MELKEVLKLLDTSNDKTIDRIDLSGKGIGDEGAINQFIN